MSRNEAESPTLALTPEQLKDLLVEMRKPVVDEAAELRKETQRERLRGSVARKRKQDADRIGGCAHLREDNTSAIAWMRNSDQVIRGVCQRCFGEFAPGHNDYPRLRAIPTRTPMIA